MLKKSSFRSCVGTLYSAYKREASRRNLVYQLTKEEFQMIVSRACTYCGEPTHQRSYLDHGVPFTSKEHLNGIDRVDNSVGYILTNCVPCCKFCNYAKKDLSAEQFLKHVWRIYQFRWANENSKAS